MLKDERPSFFVLVHGMREEDQRYLQQVNVMTRMWITNSCKVSTVGDSTRNGEGGGGEGTLSGGSLELGCVRKHQAAGTRCGVPEHYHCTALLYSTVTTGYYNIYPHGQLWREVWISWSWYSFELRISSPTLSILIIDQYQAGRSCPEPGELGEILDKGKHFIG